LTKEIVETGPVFTDKNGNTWLPVNISFTAISQINKIILGDVVDENDKNAVAKRTQIQEDCLRLFDLFRLQ